MRTLFQIIQQEFQKENDLVLASTVASSDQRQEVPVPVCWLEKKAELPEP